MKHRVRTIVEGLVFPECPRWHDGALWLSDMGAEQIVRVEERADELHDDGRKALFLSNRTNAASGMNFMIGTEIYDHLEKVVDRLEDVANEINALVVDHL